MMHRDAEHAVAEGPDTPPKTNGSLRPDGSRGADAVAYAPVPLPSIPAGTASKPPQPLCGPASSPPPAGAGTTITLALVGGRRLPREAVASLLAAQDDLDVVGTFESAAEFLAADRESPPAVVLLDCDGGGPGDVRCALEMLGAARVGSRIVMLCREISEEVVRCAIAHRVGGVLLKSWSAAGVRAALRYTTTGRTVLPAGRQRAADPHPGGNGGLSPRHRQILALIAEGRRNEEIARDLNLSPNTVKFHVRALYARMGVRNRVEAVNRWAQMSSEGT